MKAFASLRTKQEAWLWGTVPRGYREVNTKTGGSEKGGLGDTQARKKVFVHELLERNISFKNLSSRVWWCTSLISALSGSEAGGSPCVWCQPGLPSKFQTSQGYIVRPCTKPNPKTWVVIPSCDCSKYRWWCKYTRISLLYICIAASMHSVFCNDCTMFHLIKV